MLPLNEEIFPSVKQPIFFINSEKFQWAGNIISMKKLDSALIPRKMITIMSVIWLNNIYVVKFLASRANFYSSKKCLKWRGFIIFFCMFSLCRGAVHQSFPDFTFLTGNWIGKMMKLKGEIDPHIAMDLCNRASLAFLQQHLGKFKVLRVSLRIINKYNTNSFTVCIVLPT